jgi:hypothetical protein
MIASVSEASFKVFSPISWDSTYHGAVIILNVLYTAIRATYMYQYWLAGILGYFFCSINGRLVKWIAVIVCGKFSVRFIQKDFHCFKNFVCEKIPARISGRGEGYALAIIPIPIKR